VCSSDLFLEIPAYRHNPMPGVRFFELDLATLEAGPEPPLGTTK
jgi:hypothetical protein